METSADSPGDPDTYQPPARQGHHLAPDHRDSAANKKYRNVIKSYQKYKMWDYEMIKSCAWFELDCNLIYKELWHAEKLVSLAEKFCVGRNVTESWWP